MNAPQYGRLAAHSQRNNDLLQAAKQAAEPVSDRRIRPSMITLHDLPAILSGCAERLRSLGIGAVQVEQVTPAPGRAMVQITWFPPMDRIEAAEWCGTGSINGQRYDDFALRVDGCAEIRWRKPAIG